MPEWDPEYYYYHSSYNVSRYRSNTCKDFIITCVNGMCYIGHVIFDYLGGFFEFLRNGGRLDPNCEVVLSCWIDTDSDAERLNVRLGKPL